MTILIVFVTLSFTGIMTFFTVKTAREDAYEHAQLIAFKGAQTISYYYSWIDGEILFHDKDARKKIYTRMDRMCKEDDLEFLYIAIPDAKNGTIEYKYISGNEEEQQVVNDIRSNSIQKRSSISQAMLDVMDGQSEREDIMIDNRFGHVISCYVPLYDEDDVVLAVIGADVSVTKLERSILGVLPKKLFSAFFVAVLIVIVLYYVMKREVVEPTEKISTAMKQFGQNGDYAISDLNLSRDNEFKIIEKSFNSMAANIRENIDRIQKYAETESRRSAELNVAENIQQGFLPQEHSADSTSEINGCMVPAKHIGGDFFDYFESHGQTVLIIADVSGKGLSGAIFMASIITLIRGFAKMFNDPHDVLTAVNRELEHTNPNMMFVTVFLAYADPENGVIRYCNAGHNPPYLMADGKIRELSGSGGLPLGVMADEVYETAEEFLPLGGTLFLYTDGVSEAKNEQGTFYGTERLEQVLRNCSGIDAVSRVRSELSEFMGGGEQYDDITMLTYTAKAKELILPASVTTFSRLRSWIMEDECIPDRIKNDIRLMAEEVFINIASYAYGEGEGEVLIRKQIRDDGCCLLQFTDSGVPFDPTKDITDIEEYDPFQQVGGLGRFVVESISDAWWYTNIEGLNIQLIIKKNETAEESATAADTAE